MYTNDDRFHVLHADNADNWDLQIKYVQKRDAGSYECQVKYCVSIDNNTVVNVNVKNLQSNGLYTLYKFQITLFCWSAAIFIICDSSPFDNFTEHLNIDSEVHIVKK